MKRKLILTILVAVLMLTSFCAYGADNKTTYIENNLLPLEEVTPPDVASPLKHYIFCLGSMYHVGINLYNLDTFDEKSFIFMTDDRIKNDNVYIIDASQGVSLGASNKLYTYAVSRLYNGVVQTVENDSLMMYAYDYDGGVCIKISLVGSAEDNRIVAEYDKTARRVYVSGEMEGCSGSMVNVVLRRKDDNSIGYICQTEIGENFRFATDFKFTADLSDYYALISSKNKSYIVNEISVFESGEVAFAALSVVQSGETVMSSVAANDVFLGINDSYCIVNSFLNGAGLLISCEVGKNLDMNLVSTIPVGTASVKSFLFQSFDNLIPLAKHEELNILNE